MSRVLTLLRTAFSLGLPSIARVLIYRASVGLGLNPVRKLRAEIPQGPFWTSVYGTPQGGAADYHLIDGMLFGYRKVPFSEAPPDWLANPISGERFPGTLRSWWEIPDFDPQVGDIKLVWELSRMDWLLAMAQQASQGDRDALVRMNEWLADWCQQNPPYRGPNWKCGQEASIRVMHLAMAALLLGQAKAPASSLRDLIVLHLRRISPTISYAIGQDNNHGTSEAAALFIGGSWLESLGTKEGRRWARQGRRWLIERATRLISKDGSFSQYSLNYHRVMLDSYSMAEIWRRHLNLPPFPVRTMERLSQAQSWLHTMVDPISGDGPNVGANDGARLLPLAAAPYRDYRPSVQLAGILFSGRRAYAAIGPWDDTLSWLKLDGALPCVPPLTSRVFDDGGFAVLRRGEATAMLRYPRFRFRPSQSDSLHLDFWLSGENILRDAGTYGYAVDVKWQNYFGGSAGHNTIQFDDSEQMPRLSRFLLGDWLRTTQTEELKEVGEIVSYGAGYQSRSGAFHMRRLALENNCLHVVDEVSGFQRRAVLRWRLTPGAWDCEGAVVSNGRLQLKVGSDVPIVRCEIVEGWESRYYLEKTTLPVLEVEIVRAGKFFSKLRWFK